MIIIFDLDDTLYSELTYVRSGFETVARVVTARLGGNPEWAVSLMLDSLAQNGRGRQFDDLAAALGASGKTIVRWMIKIYRHHIPDIMLPALSDEVLRVCSCNPLYLVTDGHKVVQSKKISALGLWSRFHHCYLTNRYGRQYKKPSPYIFQLILQRERANAQEAVYVGDNPLKDFCGIRPLGFRTVRIRQGRYCEVSVPVESDAEVSIDSLSELVPILHEWGWQI